MILTCPNCSASYSLGDGEIAPEGRRVRCIACDHRWLAFSRDDVTGSLRSARPVPARTPARPPWEASLGRPQPAPSPEPHSEPALPPEPAPEPPAVADVPVADFEPLVMRPVKPSKASRRSQVKASTGGLVWAGMAAVLIILIGLAAIFRAEIVKVWPNSAGTFALVGLPVNSLGLTLEGVRTASSIRGGHPVVSVMGKIHNQTAHSINALPIRVSFLGKDKKAISSVVAQPVGRIPPFGMRHFALTVLDPPGAVNGVEVTFAPEGAESTKASPAPAPEPELGSDATPTPPAAAIPEAVPLPEEPTVH